MGPRICIFKQFQIILMLLTGDYSSRYLLPFCRLANLLAILTLCLFRSAIFSPGIQILFLLFTVLKKMYLFSHFVRESFRIGYVLLDLFSKELSIIFSVSCELTFANRYVMSKGEYMSKEGDLRMKPRCKCRSPQLFIQSENQVTKLKYTSSVKKKISTGIEKNVVCKYQIAVESRVFGVINDLMAFFFLIYMFQLFFPLTNFGLKN